jgi:Uma2 family endonuclease
MDVFVLKGSVTGGMTDDEFLRLCLDNPDLRIERNSNLEILIMSPVTSKSSFYSGAAYAQLFNWSMVDTRGIAFDSSAGFTLPDRSVLSPDASWVSKTKWNRLTEEDKNRLAPLCPEFVIEVRSKSDRLPDLKKKMHVWIANGAELAWLIDPEEKTTYIFRSNGEEFSLTGFDRKISGEGPVAGFVLDLSLLRL